jgi:hypothetical protein
MTKTLDIVPIIPIDTKTEKFDKLKMLYENKPLMDKIDAEISKGESNYITDNRIKSINSHKYKTEGYELFRLEFSNYINRKDNVSIKAKLETIMSDQNTNKKEKVAKIKLFIYKVIDKDLYKLYKLVLAKELGNVPDEDFELETSNITDTPNDVEQIGGKHDRLLFISNNEPNLDHYQVNNDRAICNSFKSKDKCNIDDHCHWTHTGCYMSLTKELILTFVNKISDELATNNLKAIEIMQVDGYAVSDIVDYNKFTEKPGQKL